MKSQRKVVSMLTLMAALAAPQALAAGSGPLADIYAGVCETLSGTLMSDGFNGSGYLLDTGTEVVTLFGIGPARYWEEMGVDLPQVGETLTADLCWVTYSDGSSQAVVTAMELSGELIVLRDPITGLPSWRGSNGEHAAAGGGGQVQAQNGAGGAR
jgi:hypothetical protein